MTYYHLWLTPEGVARERIAALIVQLSKQCGSPRFEPHVTLLGGIEGEEFIICEQTKALAQSLQPIDITLLESACEDSYFRSLYFNVKETSEIFDAHHRAMRLFCIIPQISFQPHLSLLYGLFSLQVKETIIKSLPHDLPNSFAVSKIQLIRADSEHPANWRAILEIQM